MSLDVHLTMPDALHEEPKPRIFVRDNGQNREISREEWDLMYPDREPVTVETEDRYVFSNNITHNLGKMADEAGIYKACWRPEEIGVTKASQLIPVLTNGLKELRANPERFKKLNPPNGWGNYDGFLAWVAKYLEACQRWPDADVSVSR